MSAARAGKTGTCRVLVRFGIVGLAVALAGAAHAKVESERYTYREQKVRCDAQSEKSAKLESVRWFTAEILPQDIRDTWRSELEARVFADPGRYVTDIAAREDAYYVTMDTVQLIRDLVAVIFGEVTPRVTIQMKTVIENRPPNLLRPLETEVAKWFLEFGFQMIDAEQADQVLGRERTLQSADGKAGSLQALSMELKADLCISGVGFTQPDDGGHFQTRVEFKSYETATGRLIASQATPRIVSEGGSPDIAAAEGLQKAATDNCFKLLRHAMIAFGKPVTLVRIANIRGGDAKDIKATLLEELGPRTQVLVVTQGPGPERQLLLQVTSKKHADEIAEVLDNMRRPRVIVSETGCRYIAAEIR